MTAIIHILTDDQGYADLGCYGHPYLLTPHIDAIASAGRKFTKFLVTPVCSLTRASYITGRHPQELGMHYVDQPSSGARHWIPPHTPTVSSRLQRIGWKTGHFGKCHWGMPPQTLHPADFGYDRFFGFAGGLPNAPWGAYVRVTDCYYHDESKGTPTVVEGYVTDVIFAMAIAWITEQIQAGEDVYAEIWVTAPHEPVQYAGLAELADYPAETFTERERYYYASLANIDTGVGALVAAIEAIEALDSTYIFFGSDNGPEPHTAGHPHSAGLTTPWRGWKTSLYMGGICVPAIMRGPGIEAGSTDSRFRGCEDWMSTCLAIAGYDTSAIPGGLAGANMLSTPSDRYICREYHGVRRTGVTPAITARQWTVVKADADSKWKLLRSAASGSGDLLFDLSTDPGEETDVGASNATTLTELRNALDSWNATWAAESVSGHSFAVDTPSNEIEAVSLPAAPEVLTRLIPCDDTDDRGAKLAIVNKLLGLPRTVGCVHNETPVEVPTYGGETTHPTRVTLPVVRIGAEVVAASEDPTALANLTSEEQATLSEMIFEAGAPGVP